MNHSVENQINKIDQINELNDHLDLDKAYLAEYQKVIQKYPVSVTDYYLSLINRHDVNDPVRKMAIPKPDEADSLQSTGYFVEAEQDALKSFQHKYNHTVLLIVTNKCAVYCRYCFRKEIIGKSEDVSQENIDHSLKYINENVDITNVLLSGGDPLTLDFKKLEYILMRLAKIEHLSFIRIGTRLPVVLPDAISKNAELLQLISRIGRIKKLYLSIHVNHPNEVSPRFIYVTKKLIDCGVVINNQCVLLKGVNDKPQTLARLMTLLVENQIIPYYVFQCRPVPGVYKNFQVPLIKANEIINQAKILLDGLAKRFRFVLSTLPGKIEIIGNLNDEMIFRFHQAWNPEFQNLLFKEKLNANSRWLEKEVLERYL